MSNLSGRKWWKIPNKKTKQAIHEAENDIFLSEINDLKVLRDSMLSNAQIGPNISVHKGSKSQS